MQEAAWACLQWAAGGLSDRRGARRASEAHGDRAGGGLVVVTVWLLGKRARAGQNEAENAQRPSARKLEKGTEGEAHH